MANIASSGHEATVPIVSVPAGGFVFRAGDAADALFIISKGHVELIRRGETHGRLALLGPGDLCGEDSVFEGRVRAYDARAVNSATLFRVTADAFLDLVRVRPELAGAVIAATATRLLRARAACLALAREAGKGAGRPAAHQTAEDGRGTRGALVHIESGMLFPRPDAAEVIVGRADPKFKPDIDLSPVDVHRALSRRHAVIKRTANGDQLIEQPRVANGTFINGVRVSPGVAVSINDGDEISFGLVTTVFRTT
jgi:CRP-like cAMP-binding protein